LTLAQQGLGTGQDDPANTTANHILDFVGLLHFDIARQAGLVPVPDHHQDHDSNE
jgi:hypothetical protein